MVLTLGYFELFRETIKLKRNFKGKMEMRIVSNSHENSTLKADEHHIMANSLMTHFVRFHLILYKCIDSGFTDLRGKNLVNRCTEIL